jgi:hypothetical protein
MLDTSWIVKLGNDWSLPGGIKSVAWQLESTIC